MSSSKKTECGWPTSGIDRKIYLDCYRVALMRLVISLNIGKNGFPFSTDHLRSSDDILAKMFDDREDLSNLVRLHEIQGDSRQDLEEKAEDHFYGRFRFEDVPFEQDQATENRACKVTHEATDTFIDWSLSRLHRPSGNVELLNSDSFGSEHEFARHCATNYLVKNFWHNYVHEKLQNITHDTYPNFRGEARYDSDFEADNLGNLFLVQSYGLPVNTKGQISESNRRKILALHARNRCNQVFQERAKQRVSDRKGMSQDQEWLEYEWRERRRIANQLSIELVASGAAATRLSIIFSGSLRYSQKSGFWRERPVIAVINGFYMATPYAPYLPGDDPTLTHNKKDTTSQRLKDIRGMRERRIRKIVDNLSGTYLSYLKSESNVRRAAHMSYEQILERAGFGK